MLIVDLIGGIAEAAVPIQQSVQLPVGQYAVGHGGCIAIPGGVALGQTLAVFGRHLPVAPALRQSVAGLLAPVLLAVCQNVFDIIRGEKLVRIRCVRFQHIANPEFLRRVQLVAQQADAGEAALFRVVEQLKIGMLAGIRHIRHGVGVGDLLRPVEPGVKRENICSQTAPGRDYAFFGRVYPVIFAIGNRTDIGMIHGRIGAFFIGKRIDMRVIPLFQHRGVCVDRHRALLGHGLFFALTVPVFQVELHVRLAGPQLRLRQRDEEEIVAAVGHAPFFQLSPGNPILLLTVWPCRVAGLEVGRIDPAAA